MKSYDHLIGRPFAFGTNDCGGFLRDFYRDVFDIYIPDYARPNKFWEHDLDIYMEVYEDAGFYLIHDNPRYFRAGDVSLAAIQSRVANHAMIHLGDGQIAHHFINRLSEVSHYRGIWRNNTVATIRHKDLKLNEQRIDLGASSRPV